MAVKIKGKKVGENPKEQLKLEKKRFENKIKSRQKKEIEIKEGQTYLCSNIDERGCEENGNNL